MRLCADAFKDGARLAALVGNSQIGAAGYVSHRLKHTSQMLRCVCFSKAKSPGARKCGDSWICDTHNIQTQWTPAVSNFGCAGASFELDFYSFAARSCRHNDHTGCAIRDIISEPWLPKCASRLAGWFAQGANIKDQAREHCILHWRPHWPSTTRTTDNRTWTYNAKCSSG